MSWWGFQQGKSAMMVIVETPDDAGYRFSHPAGGPTVIGPRWLASLGRLRYARSVRMCFFDSGNYVTLAKRYRRYVQESGLFVSLKEKIARRPEVERLLGAPHWRQYADPLRCLLNGGFAWIGQTGGKQLDYQMLRQISALQRRVGLLEMTNHEFLDGSFRKERTTFADGTTVTIDRDADTFNIQPPLFKSQKPEGQSLMPLRGTRNNKNRRFMSTTSTWSTLSIPSFRLRGRNIR